MSKVEERLAALGHKVPDPGPPVANFVNAVRTGNLVFVSGHGPRRDGEYVFRGKVGSVVDVETGRTAAELTMLNCLGSLKQEIGDLDQVVRVVKLLGMVNCAPEFTDQPKVINGGSGILVPGFTAYGPPPPLAAGVRLVPIHISVSHRLTQDVVS